MGRDGCLPPVFENRDTPLVITVGASCAKPLNFNQPAATKRSSQWMV